MNQEQAETEESVEYRVCKDIYPKGHSYNREPGFYLEPTLKAQLDILLKNIANDWDFTIIITGGGEVRVGKSVLAMQIGAYWTHMIEKLYGVKVPFNVKDNFVFDGKQLIHTGNELGEKYQGACLIYDEAGADLAGTKVMTQMTQDVLDYYRECGQYNLCNLLVMPEYFDLPKAIALSRSIFLIDVYYLPDSEGIFQRGYFKFYSRPNKKHLYLKGKKDLNYNAHPYDFRGRFLNFYPIDESGYRNAKIDALKKRESRRRSKFQLQRDASWYLLTNEFKMTQQELGIRMEQLTGIFVPQNTLSDATVRFKVESNDAGFSKKEGA